MDLRVSEFINVTRSVEKSAQTKSPRAESSSYVIENYLSRIESLYDSEKSRERSHQLPELKSILVGEYFRILRNYNLDVSIRSRMIKFVVVKLIITIYWKNSGFKQ